jgi:histidyl-tRNA synthetase
MAKTDFQSPKGTNDVLPDDQPYWRHVEQSIGRIVGLFGYDKIDLPVFEETALFRRGVGEGTDIVEKEMYTFPDKGGTSLTLRPEFTAGTVRAFLEHGMDNRPLPVRLYSQGPVFRYERPQAGRFRQHTQFNVEALGEQDPALDMEVMSVAWQLFRDLGFRDLSFQINSIGCPKCRPGYIRELAKYYAEHRSALCEDCTKRLEKNPLRLLDCKNPQCRPLVDGAPSIETVLCPECGSHFRSQLTFLEDQKRPYTINRRLVRGLDYYTKTVFEVWVKGIGAQNAVCGGGRYDGLAEALGGPPTPGVGFAAGMERIVLTLKEQQIPVLPRLAPRVFFVVSGEAAKRQAVRLLGKVREAGMAAAMAYGDRSFKAQFREANRVGAAITVILGDDEIGKKTAVIKRMDKGDQEAVAWDDLVDRLKTMETGS